jgi:glycosyltransferase involved in cell wall biosynthesis
MPEPFQMPDDGRGRASERHAPDEGARRGPLVSVLLPTYNRRRYLRQALASVVQQTYRNLEIFVIRDGGEDVSDVVGAFDDPRVIFLNRGENRGKPYSLNEALGRARGEYVAYLDDDDMYYRHHVQVLVDALEGQTDCQVAYSDLYKAYCNVKPDGVREILSKHVEISRDFDRFMMLYFNHVLHVSLMHRRDLVDRTGLYNEKLNVLIDWDMTRRLSFFSDFVHVPTITGEFYGPIGECDRISVQRRKDPGEYLRNVLAIRTTHPPKPWSKLEELSIVLVVDHVDKRIAQTLVDVWRHTFYPYRVYIPMAGANIPRLDIEMPNVICVPVVGSGTREEKVDAALRASQGAYVAVVPQGLPISEMWVEDPLHALIKRGVPGEGFLLGGATDSLWAAVLRRDDLQRARAAGRHLSVEASLAACGITVRAPELEELPFLFDEMLRLAGRAEAEGDWGRAAKLFEYTGKHYRNELWMKARAARAYFRAGNRAGADRLSREINQVRPTVATLLLEAKVCRQQRDYVRAIRLLSQAEDCLGGPVELSCHGVGTVGAT